MTLNARIGTEVSVQVANNVTYNRFYLFALLVSDTIMLVVAFTLAYWLRFNIGIGIDLDVIPDPQHYFQILPYLIPLWLLLFFLSELYNFRYLLGGTQEYSRAFSACMSGMILVVLATFIEPNFVVARAWLLMFWLLSSFFVTTSRFVLRRTAYQLRHKSYFVTPVIIIGTNEEAMALAQQLSNSPTSGVKVIGFISETRKAKINKALQTEAIKDIPILGTLNNLPILVEQWGVQAIIAATTALKREELLCVYEQLANFPEVDLHLSSGLFEVITTGVQVHTMESVPFVTLNRVRLEPLEMFFKTMIDYTLVLSGIICLLPLFAILALLIRLDSPGPIFFRRKVMGMGGKPFDAFKFRTMRIDGDEMLARDYPELKARLDANHKLKYDPRITRVGHYLRRFSLDELPQLFNILLGQMSLVGPRMINPIELEKFGRQRMNLLTVKPGLTGLWQVSGRSDLTYDERVRLDMYYIHNYSIWMDLQILFIQTLPAVLKGTGAY
jgi:exopolysaccharide biosynthesis polyprenyl glycosylphosphotransferase